MIRREVDWDTPIRKYQFEACWNCGAMIRTKNKQKLSLFMLDHWGMDHIRRCKPTKFGKLVKKYFLWKYRNV